MDLSNKVLEHLARKYQKVRKGVSEVMVGRILEYEAKTIKNEGRKEGMLEICVGLINDGIMTLKEVVERYGVSEQELEAFQKKCSNIIIFKRI